VHGCCNLICDWKIDNRVEVLPDGPLILVSKHLSWLDIPLLGLSLRRQIAFMAKKEYFTSRFHRVLLHLYGGFTVERGTVDRKALDIANEMLQQGLVLGIFPEGTRSRTCQLMRGRLGAAFVAFRNNAHIIPVGISGTEQIKSRYEDKSKIFCRPKVTLNVGKPFKLPECDGRPGKEELVTATEDIMTRLALLLPEKYRGVYADKVNSSVQAPL